MMTVAFDIEPFVGAHPIRFGMSRMEVHQLLGQPESSQTVWDGNGTIDYWNGSLVNIGYDLTEMVNHIGFAPGGCELRLLDSLLWTTVNQPDPNPELLRRDADSVESVGILYFRDLGISTTGYHDDDVSQRAIAVSPRGAWDDVLPRSLRPDLQKYL
jgi:hypothetical protein